MNCKNCMAMLETWITSGLSGTKCLNGCYEGHSIDLHPDDFQTQKLRKIIIEAEKVERPERLSEEDWLWLEIKYREEKGINGRS